MADQQTKHSTFFRLVKVDETKRQAWGVATAEVPDKSHEICDYRAAKKAYQQWSKESADATKKAGQELSLGNVRLQHTMQPVGKVIDIEYRDDEKEVYVGVYIHDDGAWEQIQKGILTGFSHGGEYQWRICNKCGADMLGLGQICPKCEERVETRYAPTLAELSVVDNPCLGKAHFEAIKADGSTETRQFAERSTEEMPSPVTPPPKIPSADEVAALAVQQIEKRAKEKEQRTKAIAAEAKLFAERGVAALKAASEKKGRPLKKEYGQMDSLWRQLYNTIYLHQSAMYEGANEGDDERDYARADQLADVIELLADIIVTYTGEEIDELQSKLKTAATKAAEKGTPTMSLSKATKKSLSTHFEAQAKHHEKCAKCEAEKAGMHKAAGEHDDCPEHLKAFHKGMSAAHEATAKEHEDWADKCHKMAEACGNAKDEEEEEGKTAKKAATSEDKQLEAAKALLASVGNKNSEDEQLQAAKSLLASLGKSNGDEGKKPEGNAEAGGDGDLQKAAVQWMTKMFQDSLEKASNDESINELFTRFTAAKTAEALGKKPETSTAKIFIPRGGVEKSITIQAEELGEDSCGL